MMEHMYIILIGLLFLLLFVGLPVAYCVLASSVCVLALMGQPLLSAVQRLNTGVDTYVFIAIPLFTFAGYLMDTGGISKRLVSWCEHVFFWIPGSLGAITAVTCMFFAALTGSGPATVAAIGGIMLPELLKRGYTEGESSSLIVAAGCLGPIIPPSIIIVIYGATMNVSISQMLMGAVVPGIMLGVGYIVINAVRVSRNKNIQRTQKRNLKEILVSTYHSIPVLILPVVILGGIYSGIFTPTEAACAGVVTALIVMAIYGEFSVKRVLQAAKKTAYATGAIIFIVGAANLFSYTLAITNATKAIAALLTPILVNKALFWIFLNIILLIVGALMEAGPAIVIFAPLLAPIGVNLGIDPVQLGCVFSINLAIGLMTPPIGSNIFTAVSTLDLEFTTIVGKIWPYIAVSVIALFLFSFVEPLVMFLPRLMA